MFKDLFLALILGALLGFGLTGAYFTFTKTQKTTPTPTPTPQISSIPSPIANLTQVPDIKLEISTPTNDIFVNTSSITVSGSTSPKTQIIVNTPISAYNTQSDDKGVFSISVNLEIGANEIKVTAIDQNDNQVDSDLTVTYSTTKI